MKKITSLIGVCLILTISTPLNAQNFIEDVLKEPIKKAIAQSTEVRIQEMEGDVTQMEMDAVKSKKLPQVSFMGGYGFLYSQISFLFPTQYLPISGIPFLEDPLVSNFQTQTFMGMLSARQVIYTGNQINNGIKALEEKQKAERFLAEAGKEEIAKEVIQTFDQLMLLKEADKLIEDSEKRLHTEHKKVIRAIENGLAIPYDRDKIKLAILELEEKKLEAQGNKNVLLAKLEYLTRMTEPELESTVYELKAFLLNEVALNVENRTEIKALKAGKKAKEFAYRKEKGTYLPTVFAFGNLMYLNAFDTKIKLRDVPIAGDTNLETDRFELEPAAAVGVGLKWDLFKGNENNINVKKAEIELQISNKKLKDTEEKFELLRYKNKSDFKTAEQKLLVAQQRVIIAENNLDLVTKQYSAGLVDLTERLASENEFYKVNLNYYNQILNQRSATVELLLSTGELLDKIYN
ncbi:TolC family protein [Xanthomarina sp. F1114]|uniref:TolC family protein n=1 Tax=Xanthomarina sp. F1114 TaxID=2996019 RepID=UPI00225E6D51|nr:TolC family protein [Xanthomarina sp. F1114]MCX7548957.1 TolC family protein [Xanthomarina sp. F1114]